MCAWTHTKIYANAGFGRNITGRKAYNPSAECRRLVSCYPIDQLSDSISILV